MKGLRTVYTLPCRIVLDHPSHENLTLGMVETVVIRIGEMTQDTGTVVLPIDIGSHSGTVIMMNYTDMREILVVDRILEVTRTEAGHLDQELVCFQREHQRVI